MITVQIRRAGKAISHAVYVATSNVDEFVAGTHTPTVNMAQTGVLVRGNSGLRRAYDRYSDEAGGKHPQLGPLP